MGKEAENRRNGKAEKIQTREGGGNRPRNEGGMKTSETVWIGEE